MYAGPEDGRARTIQQTLVSSNDRAVPEHHVPQTRQALDYQVAGDGVLHAAAIGAGVVRGAVVLESAPLVGVEAGREVSRRWRRFVRARGHVLLALLVEMKG